MSIVEAFRGRDFAEIVGGLLMAKYYFKKLSRCVIC